MNQNPEIRTKNIQKHFTLIDLKNKNISSFIFNPNVFLIISFLGILIISLYAFFILNNEKSIYNYLSFSNTLLITISVYLVNILILFLHELGHSSASYYFKKPVNKVNMGFYFIFPVFFVDLTSIWTLKKHQKNIINLAGIYVQLIINCIFIGLFFLFPKFENVFFVMILYNTFSMIFNLNPFLRTDGYWVLSDSLGVYNLREKSNQLIKSYFFKSKNLNFGIIIFSLFRVLFYSLIIFYLINIYYYNILLIPDLIESIKEKGFSVFNIFRCIVIILPLIFTLLFLRKKLKKT